LFLGGTAPHSLLFLFGETMSSFLTFFLCPILRSPFLRPPFLARRIRRRSVGRKYDPYSPPVLVFLPGTPTRLGLKRTDACVRKFSIFGRFVDVHPAVSRGGWHFHRVYCCTLVSPLGEFPALVNQWRDAGTLINAYGPSEI